MLFGYGKYDNVTNILLTNHWVTNLPGFDAVLYILLPFLMKWSLHIHVYKVFVRDLSQWYIHILLFLHYNAMLKQCVCYDLRKFFFTNRVVDMWNSLPDSVVHAESTDIFKKRIDKFWSSQEVIYNYHSEIQETRSRSLIN